ncbi:PREDICTED: Down syndrome cell adhesion molecule homolog [Amphimedon queenslandica]|uniref:Uncharacterized protein n=1 Tax=Amphimedon queenslandica TaxID=400682 RepID=A0A1X7UPL0_AMPQE|nr:PREDICTED: Down syndrome cell adhesion molecule homolog [Amphimedon queenslandica]|eukprot:XP_019852987.1 PREDICTED: Down syndrome cell adhesion molecule homolog [Amphimedon queenslandica]
MSCMTLWNLIFLLFIYAAEGQCPANTTSIFVIAPRTINVPLTEPACLGCRFLNNQGDRITFSDGMWSRGGTLTLNDGDFNGNVSISTTSDTIYLTLNYPDDVVSVGDTLVCSSTQAGSQNTVTIGAFNFLNPEISPSGTAYVTEGSNLTLSCSDPGNTGTTNYVWLNSTGDALTSETTSPPLNLQLNLIQRSSSGVYTCSSTKPSELPGVTMDTSVTIDVQYPPEVAVSHGSISLTTNESVTINCTYTGNPSSFNVTWQKDGSLLIDADSQIDTQSTTSELTLSLVQMNDSGSYVCIVENIVGSTNSNQVIVAVQVPPEPVMGLMANTTSTSVTLYWSLGFDGNSNITEIVINYSSSSYNGTITIVGDMVTEAVIRNLHPSTIYSFSITTVNDIGTSNPVRLSVMTDPLTPPHSLSVLSLGSTETTIAWAAVWNLSTQYQVMLSKVEDCNYDPITIVVASSGETMEVYTITGLKPVTNYTVSVTAQFVMSNMLSFMSQPSESISFLTAASAPSINQSVLSILGDDTLIIQWSYLHDGGMDLIHLRVHCSSGISINLTDATITSIAVLRVENGLYNCTITSANSINSTSVLTNTVQVTNAPNACTNTPTISVQGSACALSKTAVFGSVVAGASIFCSIIAVVVTLSICFLYHKKRSTMTVAVTPMKEESVYNTGDGSKSPLAPVGIAWEACESTTQETKEATAK